MEEQKMVPLVCPDCGGCRFKVVVEQLVSDPHNLKGNNAWEFDMEQTIDDEEILEVVCVKCGKVIVERYHEKPIPKNAWDEVWASSMVDFIMRFEHYAVNRELEDEDNYEAFLKGMAKGMWTIYNFIESEMVQEKIAEQEAPK